MFCLILVESRDNYFEQFVKDENKQDNFIVGLSFLDSFKNQQKHEQERQGMKKTSETTKIHN